MPKKIRIGIDLDHVIRDINRQIVKFYQRDIDESIDVDEVNMKSDVLNTVCHFSSKYEDYPLEIFGHAGQMNRNLSRDINQWLVDLTNQEEYDVDIFFFSMKEFNLTIPSGYFFLSKIGSRVRKVIYPKSLDELKEYGDAFVTAYEETAEYLKNNKKCVIFIKMDFNNPSKTKSDFVYGDLKEFLDDNNKLNKISNILKNKKECQNKNKLK